MQKLLLGCFGAIAFSTATITIAALILFADVIAGTANALKDLLVVGAWSAFGLGIAYGLGHLLVWMFKEISTQKNENNRQPDGSHARIQKWIKVVNPRTGKQEKVFVVVNQDTMVGAAGMFHPETGWIEFNGGAPWEHQLAMSLAGRQVARHQAVAPGDKTYIQGMAGVQARQLNALNRLVERPAPRLEAPRLPQLPGPAATQSQAPPRLWSATDAFYRNTRSRLVMGIEMAPDKDGNPTGDPTGELVW